MYGCLGLQKQRSLDIENNAESVDHRKADINKNFKEISQLAEVRHLLLEDAIQLFSFFRECDDFENWMKEREKILSSEAANQGSVEDTKRKFEVNFKLQLNF